MPQISLYIDKETLVKVEKAAHREQLSISKWVGKHIKDAVENHYPADFFDLFGSIRDDSFTVEPPRFSDEIERESL